ncbi:MAG: aspartate kinase [Armatimonadota bacterium]
MIIMKFGGSSIKDSRRIIHISEIIKDNLSKKPVVVLSAMGDTTDLLIKSGEKALHERKVDIKEIEELHKTTARELGIPLKGINRILSELKELLSGISLIKELSKRTKDLLVSFGERLSIRIISSYFEKTGIKSKCFDSWDLGIITTSEFQNSSPLPESLKNLQKNLGDLKKKYTYTPFITGFIGKDKKGNITTFGRGGSDLTASLIGAALSVKEVQVWKDVDGLMSTDPKTVPGAKPVNEISFEEASELAYFGAKILHPRSIIPAMEKNIPVRVKNSYNPEHPGTVIKKKITSNKLVKVITSQRHITLIDIVSTRMLGLHGFLEKVFHLFAKYEISVDMIASSEISISLTLNKEQNLSKKLDKLTKELEEIANVSVSTNKAMVTVICDVKKSSKILEKVFDVLLKKKINVQMISQGSSKVNISFIFNDKELKKALTELHKAFFR